MCLSWPGSQSNSPMPIVKHIRLLLLLTVLFVTFTLASQFAHVIRNLVTQDTNQPSQDFRPTFELGGGSQSSKECVLHQILCGISITDPATDRTMATCFSRTASSR